MDIKKFKKLIGIIMIVIVISGLFILTCQDGIMIAIKEWGFAIIASSILIGGVILATEK